MSLALNFLWLICGGLIAGLGWFFAGLVMAISVIGLPWARSCFMLGRFSLAPFGYDVISRRTLRGYDDLGTGAIGFFGNVIWFVLFGWILALWHLFWAIALAFTIIGIPFAFQHLKLAGASLFPVGKTVQSNELVSYARREDAYERYQAMRGRRV